MKMFTRKKTQAGLETHLNRSQMERLDLKGFKRVGVNEVHLTESERAVAAAKF
jgi:hypothetical protein